MDSIWVDVRPDIKTIFRNAIAHGMKRPKDWQYMYSSDKDDYFKNKKSDIIMTYPIEKDRLGINQIKSKER